VRRFAVVIVAFAALTGCPALDPKQGLATTGSPDAFLDYNQFVCAVEPVLIRRCSYLACHGDAGHALRLYSPGKLRQVDPGTRNGRDGSLTDSEVELNFQSVSGLLYGASAAQRAQPDLQRLPLLGKPLKARFGGAEHHGVGIFPAYPAQTLEDDAEWQALVAWIGGQKQPNPVDADCAQVFTLMGLSPK
jgi:hypothetical protein